MPSIYACSNMSNMEKGQLIEGRSKVPTPSTSTTSIPPMSTCCKVMSALHTIISFILVVLVVVGLFFLIQERSKAGDANQGWLFLEYAPLCMGSCH
ncbi:hypothetical protein PRIPAC_96426 [Pristionchus pacificus]|uniref:Uncharacterized protein n=1 Tax=Pristionchus pacificus TaxID=54126 RepID=A0A2A6BD61_PRIPA|nr:hypothetical protein PRIPAC_96426 [Pristionchus pacificus]|eukprot:PDM63822.1 hypothetical protein PRIPAC_49795 [Pristionchus pacificus]